MDSIPRISQERELVEDLLYFASGIEGNYVLITKEPHDADFSKYGKHVRYHPSVPLEYVQMTNSILPVFLAHAVVSDYIEEFSEYQCGSVCHCLCSSLEKVLREYTASIGQLENLFKQGSLNMHKFCYLLSSFRETLDTLARLCLQATREKAKGSVLLDMVHNFYLDTKYIKDVSSVTEFVLRKTMEPYLDKLEGWLFFGSLQDHFGEFLVRKKEGQKSKSADFWNSRYYICQENVPRFLSRFVHQILVCGKYLVVVKEYSDEKVLRNPLHKKLELMQEREMANVLEEALSYANKLLLDVLFRENKLLQRLESLRDAFLLSNSDFLNTFFDLAQESLNSGIFDLQQEELVPLFELAIRSSTFDKNIFKEKFGLTFFNLNVEQQITKMLKSSGKSGNSFLDTSVSINQLASASMKGLFSTIRFPGFY